MTAFPKFSRREKAISFAIHRYGLTIGEFTVERDHKHLYVIKPTTRFTPMKRGRALEPRLHATAIFGTGEDD